MIILSKELHLLKVRSLFCNRKCVFIYFPPSLDYPLRSRFIRTICSSIKPVNQMLYMTCSYSIRFFFCSINETTARRTKNFIIFEILQLLYSYC